ncbi:hypothetical protein D9615_000741 [Tricholomella constricta]|uniref:Fungal-type protein kinase domain-containing protein n=1 Tax=Tricholomella constricta TaxID=117010 RepID=A0A8H5HRW7_9AGAR|nr:hypothetical protein D9615_000741 [Tricholomella constricta]
MSRERASSPRFGHINSGHYKDLPTHAVSLQRPIEDFEDRWLYALMMRFYGKLWEVGSVEAFQDVFVDCLECHYHAYVDAKVLHRDLSENNLMFKHADDTNDGNVKGILNDWDMASYVEVNDEILLSTAKHRTGTVPFMAVDLLVDGTPPAHLYRHDLESFFYILIWAALHYDFENKQRLGKVALPVALWDADLLESAMDNKVALLASPEKMNTLREHVLPGCQALLPWINALWTLLSKAQSDYRVNFNNPKWDKKTRGGCITFEKFMEALGRTPRHFTSQTRPSN